jgi:hypothetical protein
MEGDALVPVAMTEASGTGVVAQTPAAALLIDLGPQVDQIAAPMASSDQV